MDDKLHRIRVKFCEVLREGNVEQAKEIYEECINTSDGYLFHVTLMDFQAQPSLKKRDDMQLWIERVLSGDENAA